MKNGKLNGKVAVVTGASKGIGAGIAKELAAAGTSVVVNYASAKQDADRVVDEISKGGGKAIAIQANVARKADVERLFAEAEKAFGKLDILVNNAGVAPGNLAEHVCEEDFDLTLNVNLKGTFFASQAAGRAMIRQKRGCIINMSSQAGFAALPTESVYCMTKAALAHLTKCLAVEWGMYNIRVNAVAPTFIHTPGTEEALADQAFRADTIERIAALHRIGEPMEVAGAVLFLASPAASLITGHTILIDGGWTAR